MGKQWIYLIVMAFILMGFFAAWDIFSTVTGGRNEFSYSLAPIQPNLYEGLETHFEQDPKYSEYVQESDAIGEGLEPFKPPAQEVSF